MFKQHHLSYYLHQLMCWLLMFSFSYHNSEVSVMNFLYFRFSSVCVQIHCSQTNKRINCMKQIWVLFLLFCFIVFKLYLNGLYNKVPFRIPAFFFLITKYCVLKDLMRSYQELLSNQSHGHNRRLEKTA